MWLTSSSNQNISCEEKRGPYICIHFIIWCVFFPNELNCCFYSKWKIGICFCWPTNPQESWVFFPSSLPPLLLLLINLMYMGSFSTIYFHLSHSSSEQLCTGLMYGHTVYRWIFLDPLFPFNWVQFVFLFPAAIWGLETCYLSILLSANHAAIVGREIA